MVIRRPHLLAARPSLASSVLAACAVLPLLAPEVWVGWRLGVSDPVLGVLSAAEQPLSVRSPSGLWAIGLALAWFGLAYWRRSFAWWEPALVLLGGVAALARLGNTWVDAAAMVVPLARQLRTVRREAAFMHSIFAGIAVLSLGAAVLTLVITRPPELPVAATQMVQNLTVGGTVLADWRWAPRLQHQLGSTPSVLAAGGLDTEPTDFWLDYLRIAQGHERWAELLRQMNVDVLVLDSADQQRQVAGFVRTSPDWQVIFDSGGALVAQRSAP
jgi:hypothetical protein